MQSGDKVNFVEATALPANPNDATFYHIKDTNKMYLGSTLLSDNSPEIVARLEATVGHSSKNLLPITLESGSYTDGGANLDYTVDKAAGTITLNGRTRTSGSGYIVVYDDTNGEISGNVYVSGGYSDNCYVRVYDNTISPPGYVKNWNGESSRGSRGENDSDKETLISGHRNMVRIRFTAGQEFTNVVIKPMIRSGSISDDTFEPYVTPTDERIAPMIYSPINHNGIYRGKDLTNVYTIDQIHNRVQTGSFNDLYLGDYFTVSITTDIYTKFTGSSFASGTIYYERTGTLNNWVYTATKDTSYNSSKTYYTKATVTEDVSLMIAHFNYYTNAGFTDPHILLTNRNYGFITTARMNLTDTTVGGYFNSEMHQTTLPCYAISLNIALNNHLVPHDSLLTDVVDVNTPSMAGAGKVGASTSNRWDYGTVLQLMTEQQLVGSSVWTSSAYDVGCDGNKLAVFNFINPGQYERGSFWLRTIASESTFVVHIATGYGHQEWIADDWANSSAHVRPLIVFG